MVLKSMWTAVEDANYAVMGKPASALNTAKVASALGIFAKRLDVMMALRMLLKPMPTVVVIVRPVRSV
tara:strand:- start:213 stop:416 length:204 start_codon:yes stop_codon:yes gene_type:complete